MSRKEAVVPVVRLLGPVDVVDADGVVSTPGSSIRATLLALLALEAGRVVESERLLDVAWDGDPPDSGVRALRFHMSKLRAEVGVERLITTVGSGYRLDADTDLGRVQESLTGSGGEDLDAMLSLWRGDPLAGTSGCSVIEHEQQRIGQLWLMLTERLYEARVGAGEAGEVIVELTRVCLDNPLREGLWASLIAAHYQAGNQAEALRAYNQLRLNLTETLGVDPSPELQALQLRVLDQDAALAGPDRELEQRLVPPSGTVTFLFTDVEGSTQLWQDHPSDMAAALELHEGVVRSVVERNGGLVFSTAGDSFAVAFGRATSAVTAAVESQRQLAGLSWPKATTLQVRMGLHTGEAQERAGDYFGSAVNRAARIMSLAQGGQILVSGATHDVVRDSDLGALSFLELGSHRLKGLTRPDSLLQITGPGLGLEFDPIDSGHVATGNLPSAIDALVGRDDDVDRVVHLVSSQRFVTIVGVGGIGKTRLALETARRIGGDFSDGAWLCELAEVSSAEAVAAAVGQTIGCRQHPGRDMTESIAEFCRNRNVLLVLDNCEHVLGAVGGLVDVVLAHGASVSVLTTSREVLGSRREQAYPLGSLASGQPDSPAAELFVRRAEQVDPTIAWDDQQMAAVAAICQRLDGMPLAIELAASRTRAMSPIEIEAHLDDAFRLLRGGRQSIERHRTLQAAIDWSYTSLPADEQATFQFLSVFSGSWDLAAAVFVGGRLGVDEFEVIDTVSALVAKSLVIAEKGRDGLTWYRLLEPLRQYAEDALAAAQGTEESRGAHLACYIDWAKRWRNELPGSGPAWKMGLLDRFANLRAAMSWGVATCDAERASELISYLGLAQQALLLFEIGDWAEEVLELPGIDLLPNGATAAATAAMAHWWRADLPEFTRLVRWSIEMPGRDPRDLSLVCVEALLTRLSGDRQQAVKIMNRADRSDPVSDVFVSYMKLSLAQEIIDSEIERLGQVLDHTQSRWVEALLCLFAAREDLNLGRYDEAAASARRGRDAAADIGATFYVHHCVFALSDALGAAAKIPAIDANTIATTLREQRDAGQELDQWLVLKGLDLALYRLGHREVAAKIRRGWRSTVWASMHYERDLSGVPEHDDLERDASATSDVSETGLDGFVDVVLEIVDAIAEEKN